MENMVTCFELVQGRIGWFEGSSILVEFRRIGQKDLVGPGIRYRIQLKVGSLHCFSVGVGETLSLLKEFLPDVRLGGLLNL